MNMYKATYLDNVDNTHSYHFFLANSAQEALTEALASEPYTSELLEVVLDGDLSL